MVLKAVEVAPAAFSVGNNSSVSKEDDLTYDLGHLAAFDSHPLVYASEEMLKKQTRENVQLLINKIFDLPQEVSDLGPLAKLPPVVTSIPREKPLPKPKVETRWEKFAREKGIQKRKKGRMVFNEETQEYAPRWGYKRASDNTQDWAIEIKDGQDIYADHYEERDNAKKARIDKNNRQKANNTMMGRGKQEKMPSGIPVELANSNDKKSKQRGKQGTKETLEKVQFSTASMGKFDKKIEGEPERKRKGQRQKFTQVSGSEQSERERSMAILNRVLGKPDTIKSTKGNDETAEPGKKKKGKKLKNITKGHTKRKR